MDSSNDLLIGAHTSAAGGVYNALLEGKMIGATTVQLFTSNQKRWEAKPIADEVVAKWHETIQQTGLREIMSHDSYLINLGAPDEIVLMKSRKGFREEVERCLQLGITYLNFHPGAAIKEDVQKCLDRICESILQVEDLIADSNTTLLLETTAGQGSTVGYNFEQIAYILSKTQSKVPIGVCVDTCHIFVAGYDIRTEEGWNSTLKEFDRVIGLKYLRAFHLNDTMKGLGSKVDRHSSLGKGLIGLDSFRFLMTDLRTRGIPKYLETPEGPQIWMEEIKMLREFAKGKCEIKEIL